MGQNDRADRTTYVRYQVLAVACSVAVITYIHRVGFASALPKVSGDLGLGDREASWLTAAFLLAYGGFEIPGGLLGDRLGVRHVLTILVLGWSLLTGCVALAVYLPGQWHLPLAFLLVVRFLFGMFQAGGFPSLARMMADWMTVKERATAQGLIWMSTRTGGMIVPLLIGWLTLRLGGWQAALWAVAGLGLVWCAAFWPWFRNRPEEMPSVSPAERAVIAAGRSPHAGGHGPVPWGRMLRSRSVWSLCLMYGCGGFAANFYVTLLPSYLSKHRGLPDDVKDLLSSLPFACGLVACLLGGLLSDWFIRATGNRKWGRRLNGSVGMVIGAAGWLSLGAVTETWLLALVLCLIFFFNDLAMGPAWASCADIGERYAGTLGGAMNMIGNLAGALGNLLAGALFGEQIVLRFGGVEQTIPGNSLLFTIYACFFVGSALCWQGVDVTRTLAGETRPEAATDEQPR